MTSFFLAFEAFEHDISEFLTKICENGKLKFAGCWVDAHCAPPSSTHKPIGSSARAREIAMTVHVNRESEVFET